MKLGVHLPHVGPLATRQGVAAFARMAEDAGFESLWVSDHIVVPRDMTTPYPYTRDGRFPVPPDMPYLEAVATLLYVAGCTERIALGTSVCIIPWRNPVLLAKQLATLDVLSGGRLIFGGGTGWFPEEFLALDVPFEHRGTRTDEYLQVMLALWTAEAPRFAGRFYSIDNVGFAPKPLQRPHPPLWIGGDSANALRRAGRFGQAWHAPAGKTAEQLAAGLAEARRHAASAGRDPAEVQLTVRTRLPRDRWPDDAISLLHAYAAAGVAHAVLETFAPDLDTARATLEPIAREILPAVSH